MSAQDDFMNSPINLDHLLYGGEAVGKVTSGLRAYQLEVLQAITDEAMSRVKPHPPKILIIGNPDNCLGKSRFIDQLINHSGYEVTVVENLSQLRRVDNGPKWEIVGYDECTEIPVEAWEKLLVSEPPKPVKTHASQLYKVGPARKRARSRHDKANRWR